LAPDCRHARGYVLVLVLVVLALAAAAMASVCRLSLEKTVRASAACDELQRKWVVLSCQAVLLPKAEEVLSHAASPTSSVRREIRLGRQATTLVFSDEQAKANVNTLYRSAGASTTEGALRRVLGRADHVSVDLRPLPQVQPEGDDEPAPVFESLGQIFGPFHPSQLVEALPGAEPACDSLTCWGDGTLHFARASEQALRAMCAKAAGGAQVAHMLQIRAKHPDWDASEVLDQLKLSEKAREALDDLLTDDSSCHSLWIVCRSADRSWYHLAVQDASAGGSIRAFDW
jgi:hypothetical protein